MTNQPGELGVAIERVKRLLSLSRAGITVATNHDLRLILAATPTRNDGAGDNVIISNAAELLCQYAYYIRSVHSSELERHPYLPLVEDTALALSALSQKGGWQLAPVEPTPEMLNAAVDRTGAGNGMSWANRSPQGLFETGYLAMLAAAPVSAPHGGDVDHG